MGFAFQGLAQFQKNLNGLSLARQKSVKVAMLMTAMEPVQAEAERLVPISEDAPHIVDHILRKPLSKVDDEEFGGTRSTFEGEAVVAVGPSKDFFYSWFAEFGTVKHGAQPYMRPAWDQNVVGVYRYVQDAIWAWVRKTAGSAGTGGRNL